MPPAFIVSLLAALLGLALLVGGLVTVRGSGARIRMARRLGGAHEMKVGTLLDAGEHPARPVRVTGRVRCADPLVTDNDERLVAWHRDVEVRTRDGWRSIEHRREARSFELWDHDGALAVDPADAAEPLIAIPHTWHGMPADLDDTYQPAIARLAAQAGPVTAARAETRMIGVIDRLLVLATVERDGRGVRLRPPPGGYVISAMELDDAMRLLGGPRRRWLPVAVLATLCGALLTVIGLSAALVIALG
jgi:hypothetical protein